MILIFKFNEIVNLEKERLKNKTLILRHYFVIDK